MQDSNFRGKNVTMITDINNIFKSQKQLENSLSWDYIMAQWVKMLGTKFDDLSSILDPTGRRVIIWSPHIYFSLPNTQNNYM